MVVNNPHFPKYLFGWFIDRSTERIHFGVLSPHYFDRMMIKIAALNENCIDVIEGYIEWAGQDVNHDVYIYTNVNRKDFFATKQQAQNAIEKRTEYHI